MEYGLVQVIVACIIGVSVYLGIGGAVYDKMEKFWGPYPEKASGDAGLVLTAVVFFYPVLLLVFISYKLTCFVFDYIVVLPAAIAAYVLAFVLVNYDSQEPPCL